MAFRSFLSLFLASLFILAPVSFAKDKVGCAHYAKLNKQLQPNFSRKGNLWTKTFKWELRRNFATFREDPKDVLRMGLVAVSKDEVELIAFSEVDPRIMNLFVDGDKYYWMLHPNNKSDEVPYFGSETVGYLPAGYTASRSVVSLSEESPAFSIKAGTSYPHLSDHQPTKASTVDDVTGALLRQPYINQVERILPEDKKLMLIQELMILKHKETGQGVLIRDLSRIDNKNIYLTGLSIPYAGRAIARINRVPRDSFWTKIYAANTGRAKARLLIHYGLEMETPNSQNVIVEFTSKYKPTNRIVLRDTVDSLAYEPWFRALGMNRTLKKNKAADFSRGHLEPFATNSIWRFDEAGKDSFSAQAMEQMEKAHDQA